jgi:hypothetical protein
MVRHLVLALAATTWLAAGGQAGGTQSGSGFSYVHDEVAEVPWSIHILKIDRTRADLEFHTSLAQNSVLGLSTMTEQVKSLPPALGQPLAAINGDFWHEGHDHDGDPMGLHILEGELVSGPCPRSCFWIDPAGQPHVTNVLSRFTATWPGGQTATFGLNEERTNGHAVLYTPRFGPAALTKGGREIVLERAGASEPWLPLRIGQTFSARVREIRETGGTALAPGRLVLSLSPALAGQMPKLAVGNELKISTATTPDLTGVTTAIGGGPALVRDGKALSFTSSPKREPRSALGWNDRYYFFLVVDGRQANVSAGMTFPELANYMEKLGCQVAMNLDGGGSSTIWVRGQVMNSPCYGHERPMANSLVLTRKPGRPNPTRRPDKSGAK